MGADMIARTIYLLADTTFDLAAAEATATRLTEAATQEEIDALIDGEWIDIEPHHSGDIAALRQLAEKTLHQALRTMAASLDSRDVDSYRLDHADNPGVDIYITGGLSGGDGPTDAYDAWSVIFDDHDLPTDWAAQLGQAAGLIHPHGTGGIVAAVTFRAWA